LGPGPCSNRRKERAGLIHQVVATSGFFPIGWVVPMRRGVSISVSIIISILSSSVVANVPFTAGVRCFKFGLLLALSDSFCAWCLGHPCGGSDLPFCMGMLSGCGSCQAYGDHDEQHVLSEGAEKNGGHKIATSASFVPWMKILN
jgi:hypothetical protein